MSASTSTHITSNAAQIKHAIAVALPVPLYRLFDYVLTEDSLADAQIGCRVLVRFGAKKLVGVIVHRYPEPIQRDFVIRPIDQLLDSRPILQSELMALLQWTAQYYHFPLGEALHIALPVALRQTKTTPNQAKMLANQQSRWFVQQNADLTLIKRSPKQAAAFDWLAMQQQGASAAELSSEGFNANIIKALSEKDLIVAREIKLDCPVSSPAADNSVLAEAELTANKQQQQAIDAVVQQSDQYHAYLLDGVTGSGKTEVYLQIMQHVLAAGRQVLLLVPEIGLTLQTIQRVKARFTAKVVLMHSGLSDGARLEAWLQAKRGDAKIVIGTRSALLSDFADLGLIIVDEEHDLSYKQQDSLRYHARDVALKRAHQLSCPVLLGSATPSFESLYLVQQNKMQHLLLAERANDMTAAKIEVIDLKKQRKQAGLAPYVIEQMRQHLAKQQQVLLFLNRRGFAPILICQQCGWQADCPHCDAHFTVHLQPYQQLNCHHCGKVQHVPTHCPNCNAQNFDTLGLGTAKLEQQLSELFCEVDVIRVDKDNTRTKSAWADIYQRLQQPKAAIILGTQMLAKGHHFPYVSLVAILDIDAGFLSVDFRAPERTAQLIMQVAGRAGREKTPSQVILQSYRPENPLLQRLIQHGYANFAAYSLQERQLAALPPTQYAALVRVEARQMQDAVDFLQQGQQQLKLQLPAESHLDLWSPVPAPMEKKSGRFRAHSLMISSSRSELHQRIQPWWQWLLQQKNAHLRLSLDIDPQDLS